MAVPTTGKTGKEDVWIHTVCNVCQADCGIIAHRVNGVVVKIEGDPDYPGSRGKICAGGHSSIMSLYDPNRLLVPLKRTNPEKGIGIDPQWKRITWEEALTTITEWLIKIRKENPRKLIVANFDDPIFTGVPFAQAFGTPNEGWSGYFCGSYLHPAMYLTNGTWHCDFDTVNCKYLMLFGNQAGFGAGLNPNIAAQNTAEARKNGMRVVVVDPLCCNAAAKADEWVPIRPGTDGALLLAMANVLLNELGIYDKEFLAHHTNAPYLVKADGYYLRQDGKPMVWDVKEGKAKSYDSAVLEYALEDKYTVDGVAVTPAFQLLKEHVKRYTPESAAEITTVPADTIRRLAREFGTAASIGSTVTIDGEQYPLRPVAVNIWRGAGAHKHGIAVGLAVQILNMIVGAFYAVGGHRGMNLIGPDYSWEPTEDGGIIVPPWKLLHRGKSFYNFEVKPAQSMRQDELFPICNTGNSNYIDSILNGKRVGLPYVPEVALIARRNLFLGGVNKDITSQALKKLKFIAFFGTHLDEVADFADIALPEAHFLEKTKLFPTTLHGGNTPQTGYFMWGIRQPVVPPAGEARDWVDVLEELADRAGFLGDLYEAYNRSVRYGLVGDYKLNPSKKYTKDEINDRRIKSEFGEGKDLAWFKEHGFFNLKRKPEETYPLKRLKDLKARFPLYFENMRKAGDMVAEVAKKLGTELELEDYEPLPNWRPCPAYSEPGGYDLYAVNFRVPTNHLTWSIQNPYMREVAQLNSYATKIWINPAVAGKKGIADGDRVLVESAVGSMKGEAKLTECVHPEALGISGHFGGWAKGKPLAAERGNNFNALLPYDDKHKDPVSTGLDACVRVRVRRM